MKDRTIVRLKTFFMLVGFSTAIIFDSTPMTLILSLLIVCYIAKTNGYIR